MVLLNLIMKLRFFGEKYNSSNYVPQIIPSYILKL